MRVWTSRSFSFRLSTLFAALVVVGMLSAASAQAITWGEWRAQFQESEHDSNLFSRIFDGRSSFESEGSSSGGSHDFSLSSLWDIDLSSIVAAGREWLENYRETHHASTTPNHGSTPMPEPTAALLFAAGIGVVATTRRLRR